MSFDLDSLASIPRLGWGNEATPVLPLADVKEEFGLGYVGVKRDDLCDALHGSTKVRKLDFLLASEPWSSLPGWTSVGAIGSGHLVAVAAAASLLNRRFDAHMFWEPISEGVEDNLALVASEAHAIRFYPSRVNMALRSPRLLLSKKIGELAVIPPGATCASAMVGTVRGGLELAAQIRSGLLPCPDRIYVALGTGGTVVGLAVGLSMAGIKTKIHAVATVEWWLSIPSKLERLRRELLRWLEHFGLKEVAACTPLPIVIDRSQLGPGYGVATEESNAACAEMNSEGLHLEPIYTGKTMAAMLVDGSKMEAPGECWLFWHTARREPLPAREGWQNRLPAELARRLFQERTGD